ncbi:type II toxin-antitoxin system VapC family toxin [Verminephrobacter eiseniae]|uniref:type II toxin-antitoxin system VapC family toxin n=1 Tax=Verminephrobacter eiseniae TaxID=364317 RepID=UPI0010D8DD6A|nr:type II toxin-antitoxin system VapC family toxin [Verminephrobacter eiseniae]KAB7597623.1 type II toxin-antitoxin system VapC family toxin [Verminephrobacter sp. Larva24]MCW5231936.1 type II toxin-antitoxin system VapC family toxin [Verminephrobacter eiseniae]MCW5296501.1 type II toxin-antitoxin system VapC family toxin [Verminephrobacter eiseniae]MCW8186844.1 type II toxin-antitoxin system VapC family toxin [Verminephrobacter eiseniae]MCW8225463.1 type II toxin-antitoxin system VapC family
MSGYLLDTNIISDVIRNPNGPAAHRIEQAGPKQIFTSIIVAAELRYGCAKKGSPQLRARVEGLLETVPVLPLDIPAAAGYGGIRAALEAAGQSIGMNDLLIAAHACALGLTLVTDDTREFSRIRDLKVENWLER